MGVVPYLRVSPMEGTIFSCLPHTTSTDPSTHLLSFPVAQHHTLAPNGCRGPWTQYQPMKRTNLSTHYSNHKFCSYYLVSNPIHMIRLQFSNTQKWMSPTKESKCNKQKLNGNVLFNDIVRWWDLYYVNRKWMKYKHVALAKELWQGITEIIAVKPVPVTLPTINPTDAGLTTSTGLKTEWPANDHLHQP